MGRKTKTKRSRVDARRPVKLTGRKIQVRPRDEGPGGWYVPLMESVYTRLDERGTEAARVPVARTVAPGGFTSRLQPGRGDSVLASVGQTAWRDRLAEYKRRKVAAAPSVARAAVRPGAPAIPGARNWLPLGPTVVLDGQTVGNQPVGGRVSGLAVGGDGRIVYAASANGGVFRSDDGATTWRALMDGFDVDPTNFASTSLACGAIAIDPADPDRVYVGTGEGDTHLIFRSRIVNALPAYRGIGPIRTDDGGATWVVEAVAASAPPLAGEAFFALAVDPRDRDNVVGATTAGLYQRVPGPGGVVEWVRRRSQPACSVVVAASPGITRFFAAELGGGVLQSKDGSTWAPMGTGFPTTNVGRIALAVQPGNPERVYAFVATHPGGIVHGVYRVDGEGGPWRRVDGLPDVLPAQDGRSQGDYDLAIAIDPKNANIVYLGGSYAQVDPFPASVWRCSLKTTRSTLRVESSRSIGTHAHADVHVLVHTPGDPDELWCGCDGGIFLNRDPRGTGEFASQNNGLACLCCNFIGQHPTDPNVLFTGLQDNGTARTDSGPMWTHVSGGDGGYCLVNWARPDLVLVFANGRVLRSTSGGASDDAWSTGWNFPWVTMTQPIVCAPFNPARKADADVVAVGAGEMVFVSTDFAASWPEGLSMSLPAGSGSVYALAFASPSRLFVGTTSGQVFRADRSGRGWSLARLDDVAAGPLGLVGLISDIAVDWVDATLASIYVAFGGLGDTRRVWWFDGTVWSARSGAGATGLLDIEHNALVVDRAAPHDVYAAADIGVWHSPDRGQTWQPLQNGLPDAPVFDLQVHPTQRLLRAATHGRGVYELALD
jgi:hypothetical protein